MVTGKKTALIYCENQLGLMDGKTAAGLIRHSEIYTAVFKLKTSENRQRSVFNYQLQMY
jgi:hypothetical protein